MDLGNCLQLPVLHTHTDGYRTESKHKSSTFSLVKESTEKSLNTGGKGKWFAEI